MNTSRFWSLGSFGAIKGSGFGVPFGSELEAQPQGRRQGLVGEEWKAPLDKLGTVAPRQAWDCAEARRLGAGSRGV